MSLMEPLANRLGSQTTPAKSLVMPRYPEYKDSGVAWLGEVPGHWEVKRLKYSLQLLTEKTDRREHPVALENIESWSGRFVETETEFQGDGVAFDEGDILFGKLRPYLAKAYRAEFSGEAVGDFHVMRPAIEVDSRFSLYQILNRDFIAIVDGSTFGAKMPRVSWDFMANLPLSIPPTDEQTAIAAFLDRETGKIDALVAEQEKLIQLLREKRQAVISHAVTKGLSRLRHSGESRNPAEKNWAPASAGATDGVKMKDSGIEWLGEVPEHWTVQKLAYLADKVGDGLHGTPEYVEDSEYFFVNGNNLCDGKVAISDTTKCVSESEANKHAVELSSRTLLMSINGTIGNLAFYNGESIILGKSAAYINCGSLISRIFLYYFLQSTAVRVFYELEVTGTTIFNLSLQTVRATPIVLPSRDEQLNIVASLDRETARLDALTAEAQRGIALLKERRSALISAAVTGKIDVRGAVIPAQAGIQ